MSFLSEYEFEIKHIKGKENKVVVALSCHANLLFASSSYKSDLENQILKVENFDKKYQNLKENTTENERNRIQIDFSLNGRGLLLHKNILYIPNVVEIKLTVMNELHKRPYSRHLGYQKMITMIKKYFSWKKMKK